ATSGGRSRAAMSGVPRLPPVKVRRPARSKARPTRVVVVLLPLVPVTARIGHPSRRQATSISLQTVTPRSRAAVSSRALEGTPGLGTTRSIPASSGSPSSPRRSSTAQAEFHGPGKLLEDERLARAEVGETHAHAARREGTRDRLARAPRAQDEGLARQPHQRSFRVESASSAHTTETIQKRTMIWGSGHPRSSK